MKRKTVAGVVFALAGAAGIAWLNAKSDEAVGDRVVLSAATEEFIRIGQRPSMRGNSDVSLSSSAASVPNKAASSGRSDPCRYPFVQDQIALIKDAEDPNIHSMSSFDRVILIFDAVRGIKNLEDKNLAHCFSGESNVSTNMIQGDLLSAMRQAMEESQKSSLSFHERWRNLQRIGILLDVMEKAGTKNGVLHSLGFVGDNPGQELKSKIDQVHMALGNLAINELKDRYRVHPREGIILELNADKIGSNEIEDLRRYYNAIQSAYNISLDVRILRVIYSLG